MGQKIMLLASLIGALAVMLGAFGAHGLRELISAKELSIYETGNKYHFYHTFAIFVSGLLSSLQNNRKFSYRAAWCFIAGILFFSGSLYLLATSSTLGIAHLKPVLGPMTPIGGLFFIVGWIFLALSVKKGDISLERRIE